MEDFFKTTGKFMHIFIQEFLVLKYDDDNW